MRPTDAAQLQIVEVKLAEANTLIVLARCLAGVVRPGTRLQRIQGAARRIDVTVTELWRNPSLQVEFIDPPHAVRVILTGSGGDLLHPGDLLQEA